MFTFKKLELFNLSNTDSNSIYEFRKKYGSENDPDEPVMNQTSWEKVEKDRCINNDKILYLFSIFDESKQIGLVNFSFYKKDSNNYNGNENNVFFTIKLLKDYARKGMGTFSLNLMLEICKQHEKSNFISKYIDASTKVFFNAIGAQIVQYQIYNRLYLDKINWDMVEKWNEEGETYNPKSNLEIFNGTIPDDYIDQFIKTLNESSRDQPQGNIQSTARIFDRQMIQNMVQTAKENGIIYLTALCIEQNGEVSGLSLIDLTPDKKEFADQMMTGVSIKYRGKKIGKWLKSKMLLYIKENYPEVKIISTGNALSNAPMLHINTKLGFTKHKEIMTIQIARNQLESYLNSKSLKEYQIID